MRRLAYCTGIRRCDCSTNTTNTTITSPSRQTRAKTTPPATWRIRLPWEGSAAAIDVKIRRDIPLPTPRAVISSPSHMMRAVPAVIVTTMTAIRNRLVSGMIGAAQPGNRLPLRARATMPVACRTASAIVR